MKKLVFKDGVKTYLTDASTILDCTIVLTEFGDIDALVTEFTADNLNGGTLDDVEINNIIPVSVTATKSASDSNVTVHFTNREKTKEEILDDKMRKLEELIAKYSGKVS